MAIRDLLRLLMVTPSLAPAIRTNGTATGSTVDLRGFDGAMIAVNFGAYTDGTHTPSVLQSVDGVTFTSCVYGTDLDAASNLAAVSSSAGANTVQQIGYIGSQRYLAVAITTTVAAGSTVLTSLIVTEGFTLISAGVTSTQNGVMGIQRYLDAGGTVPQGGVISAPLAANAAANLDIVDGRPFASFTLSVSNASGSVAASLGNFALLLQASAAHAPNPGIDGSASIAAGGGAQNLFSGAVPLNGYAIFNPDTSNELWASDSTTAAANAAGSIRVAPLSYYATEPGQKPAAAVSVFGAVTGQKITARRW